MSAVAASSASAASSLALVDQLLAAAQHGRAADIGRARAHRADTANAIGIAHGDLDVGRIDAEQLRSELGEAGLQPLPHALVPIQITTLPSSLTS